MKKNTNNEVDSAVLGAAFTVGLITVSYIVAQVLAFLK